MAMKFDKDMLIKQKFWVLLAVTVPLVLTAVFILVTAVGADIESKRKKAADALNTLNKTSNPVGPQVIEERNKVAEEWKGAETKVHQMAFSAQEPLFYWAKAVEDRFNFLRGNFATEIKIIAAPANKEAYPADADDLHHGQVTSIDPDSMVIKGKDDKEVRFQRTAKIRVTKNDKNDQWQAINNGDFVSVGYYRSKYFYDPLTENELTEFGRSYLSQIHPILQMVDPVDAKGAGTVQFKGWPYNKNQMPPAGSKFFTFVAEDWKLDNNIYDEAWMAQEDLWIQRELFRIIRAANDSVGVCEFWPDGRKAAEDSKTKIADKTFEEKGKPLVFANPNYELKFEWVDAGKVALTVKNRMPRRQKLDVHFRVKFNKSDNADLSSEVLLMDGEPLAPRGMEKDSSRKEFVLEKGRIQRTGIYAVEQVLTWETAAVKRIDATAIGSPAAEIAHSHKTFPQGSQPYRKEEKKEEKKDEGGPMGAANLSGSSRFGQGKFSEGAAGEASRGPNGVLKDRYLEVSEQSRRVPVGMALIVDQDHIGRVLTAFNNSKLRFLTTQVLLNRYSASVRPQVAGGAADLGGGAKDNEGAVPSMAPADFGVGPRGGPRGYSPGPRGGAPPMGGGSASGPPMGAGSASGPPKGVGSASGPPSGVGPMQPRLGPSPMGEGNIGAYASAAAAGASEEMVNNVEMVIYGVVTLYERYPKRKTDTAAK